MADGKNPTDGQTVDTGMTSAAPVEQAEAALAALGGWVCRNCGEELDSDSDGEERWVNWQCQSCQSVHCPLCMAMRTLSREYLCGHAFLSLYEGAWLQRGGWDVALPECGCVSEQDVLDEMLAQLGFEPVSVDWEVCNGPVSWSGTDYFAHNPAAARLAVEQVLMKLERDGRFSHCEACEQDSDEAW
jgi:hypothetical protein